MIFNVVKIRDLYTPSYQRRYGGRFILWTYVLLTRTIVQHQKDSFVSTFFSGLRLGQKPLSVFEVKVRIVVSLISTAIAGGYKATKSSVNALQ